MAEGGSYLTDDLAFSRCFQDLDQDLAGSVHPENRSIWVSSRLHLQGRSEGRSYTIALDSR
jgi:hypothetical protein